MEPSDYIEEVLCGGEMPDTFRAYLRWLNEDEYALSEFLSHYLGIDLEEAGIDERYWS